MELDTSLVVSLIALAGTLAVALFEARSRRDIERLKVDSARRRMAFEQEFQILSEAWRAVSDFEHATASLRPDLEFLRSDEDSRQRLGRKLKEFQVARKNLVGVFDAARPFYPQEIYTALEPIIREADEEMWDLMIWGEACTEKPDPEHALEEKAERLRALSAAVQDLSDRIRSRVAA